MNQNRKTTIQKTERKKDRKTEWQNDRKTERRKYNNYLGGGRGLQHWGQYCIHFRWYGELHIDMTRYVIVVCLKLWKPLILLSFGKMKLFKLDIGYGKHINANITESVPSPSSSSSVSGSINSRQMARPSHGHPTLLIYLFHRPSDLVQKLTNRGEYILKGNFCFKINWK